MTFDIYMGKSAAEWMDIEDKANHYRAKSILLMDSLDNLRLTLEMREAHIEDLEHQVTQLKKQLGYIHKADCAMEVYSAWECPECNCKEFER